MFRPTSIETINVQGAEVELQWGDRAGYDRDSLGVAVSTCKAGDEDGSGPSDGASFELRGQRYTLGQHNYSTDHPASKDDEECTCMAEIYAAQED